MKRVQYDRFGGPEVMYFGEFDVPQLQSNQIRVTVEVAAINPFDWKLRKGMMKLIMNRKFPKGRV
ncbi:hypothetical protein ABEQ41_30365 [Priestia megaterium]